MFEKMVYTKYSSSMKFHRPFEPKNNGPTRSDSKFHRRASSHPSEMPKQKNKKSKVFGPNIGMYIKCETRGLRA